MQASVPVLSFTPAELESVRAMLAVAAEPVLVEAVQRQLTDAEILCRDVLLEEAPAGGWGRSGAGGRNALFKWGPGGASCQFLAPMQHRIVMTRVCCNESV
eukprot:786339-Pelagomonas_calceolata.AAC.1